MSEGQEGKTALTKGNSGEEIKGENKEKPE